MAVFKMPPLAGLQSQSYFGPYSDPVPFWTIFGSGPILDHIQITSHFTPYLDPVVFCTVSSPSLKRIRILSHLDCIRIHFDVGPYSNLVLVWTVFGFGPIFYCFRIWPHFGPHSDLVAQLCAKRENRPDPARLANGLQATTPTAD